MATHATVTHHSTALPATIKERQAVCGKKKYQPTQGQHTVVRLYTHARITKRAGLRVHLRC